MKRGNIKHIMLICGIILVAALSRLLPHWPNMTPIGAMALFGAAYFTKKYLAILVPLIAVILSDLILYATFYSGYEYSFMNHIWVYAAVFFITLLGMGILKKVNITRVLGGSLLASGIFFLVSNIGAWLTMPIYPKTAAGLMTAYEAGLPFFWNTLIGDLLFCGVLFGAYALIAHYNKNLSVAREA